MVKLPLSFNFRSLDIEADDRFVCVELDSEKYVDSPDFKKACEGKSEVRRWKLYKATPNTASKDA